MEVVYTSGAKEDLAYWKKTDPQKIKRIENLIADIRKHPFIGIGKPEPLRFEKKGYWSRRIDQEHRLVYCVVDKVIYVAQCRYHY
jgi:toxin YoeB